VVVVVEEVVVVVTGAASGADVAVVAAAAAPVVVVDDAGAADAAPAPTDAATPPISNPLAVTASANPRSQATPRREVPTRCARGSTRFSSTSPPVPARRPCGSTLFSSTAPPSCRLLVLQVQEVSAGSPVN
jgi:hypothetical protein